LLSPTTCPTCRATTFTAPARSDDRARYLISPTLEQAIREAERRDRAIASADALNGHPHPRVWLSSSPMSNGHQALTCRWCDVIPRGHRHRLYISLGSANHRLELASKACASENRTLDPADARRKPSCCYREGRRGKQFSLRHSLTGNCALLSPRLGAVDVIHVGAAMVNQ